MSEALAHFKKGDRVKILCPNEGCEKVLIHAILGGEFQLNLDCHIFRHGNIGRLHWPPNAVAKGFKLIKSPSLRVEKNPCKECKLKNNTCHPSDGLFCPRCGDELAEIFIVSRGREKKPIIFGYTSTAM